MKIPNIKLWTVEKFVSDSRFLLTLFSSLIFLCVCFSVAFFRIKEHSYLLVSESSYALLSAFSSFFQMVHITTKSHELLFFNILSIILILGFISIAIYLSFYKSRPDLLFPISILLLSPVLLYNVLNPSTQVFALILILIAVLAIEKQKTYFAFIISILLVFFPLDIALLSSTLLLPLSASKLTSRHLQKRYHSIFFVIIFLSLVRSLILKDVSLVFNFDIIKTLFEFTFDFGNPYGISFILVLVAGIGIFTSWLKNSLFEILIAIFLLTTLVFSNLLFFTFAVSLLAGRVLDYLYLVKWESLFFKRSSFLVIGIVIAVTLFLSSTSYIAERPTSIDISFYEELSQIPSGNILYRSDYSYVASYFSNHEVIPKNDLSEPMRSTYLLYHSTDLKRTHDLLVDLDIRYVIITNSMREDVWEGLEKGLLVLLKDPNYFSLVSESENYQVYEFLQ